MSRTRSAFTVFRGSAAHRAAGGLLLALALVLASADEASARRYASIVVDAVTGEVLHADKPNRQAYPASLTKMMTLYMVFEALDRGKLTMDQRLKVSRRATKMPPSKLGLGRGQTISVRAAIMALVTKSANDVAVVVAEALGGSESNFAKLMTNKARALGMSRTTFRNASGLPNSKQLSTARDMVRLAQALMRHFPHHYRVFASKSYTYKGRKYPNHNKLLKNYSGTDGIKTGYTHASGFNLVASAVRDGRRLIGVVFGGKTGKSRDRHMRKLLDKGFKALNRRGVPPIAGVPPRKPLSGATLLAAADKRGLDRMVAQVAEGGSSHDRGATPTATQPQKVAQPEKVTRAKVATIVPVPRPAEAVGTEGASRIAALSRVLGTPSRGQGSGGINVDALAPGAGGVKTIGVLNTAAAPKLPADRAWGVQVGAYTRYGPAQIAAVEAARKVPRYLAQTHQLVSKAKGSSGPVYRARLLGLSESAARLACGALKAKAMSCVVVPPGQS